MTLIGLILKLLGPSAPIVFSLQAVAGFALAGMFAFERRVLVSLVGATGAAILPFFVLLVPLFRNFLLEPEGVVLGETFALSMFFSCVFVLIVSLDKRSLGYAAAAGAFLAFSAYFRTQFELIVLILTFAALAFAAGAFVLCRFRPLRDGNSDCARTAKTLLVCVIVANALMFPWRLHNLGAIHSMRWVITSDVVGFDAFANTEYLTSNGSGFVVDGGGNLGCALEPPLCGKGKSSDLLPVFIRHFFAWEAIKASILPKYWFASLDYLGSAAFAPTRADLIWNWLLALTFPLTFVGLLAARAYRWRPFLIWLTASFCAYLFFVHSIVHFEVRYFFLPKMFFFHMTVLLVSIAWRTRTSGPRRSRVRRSRQVRNHGAYGVCVPAPCWLC